MKGLCVATGITLLLCSLGAAQAQSPTMYQGQMDQIDRDGNGKISRSEYQAFMKSAFSKLDQNKDGSLQPGEAKQILTPAQFAKLDANGDGSVSSNEFMKQVMADFAAADRSKDGTLQ